MINPLTMKSWSPYVVGAGIGVLKYYQKNPPRVDWGFVFVVCTISAALLPRGRAARFATNGCIPCGSIALATASLLRGVIGFAGGVLMAFGARLAGGCTSGHGISGTLQLNAGSWLTVICMFIGGIATAMLLFTVL